MYILCYADKNGKNTWESVDGEDAMNARCYELEQELCCEEKDIMVFHTDDMYI